MTTITLYYPSFALPEGVPESVEFSEIADLKKNPAVKHRLFGLLGLKKTYAYKNLEPYRHAGCFCKTVFHKFRDIGYWGVATISANTEDEFRNALAKLGTEAVPPEKW